MELTLSHLKKKYGAFTALEDFTYRFTPGVYGLVGPNGAGKTTLIQIMAGVFGATAGFIEIDGQRQNTNSPAYSRHIGYLPQELALYPNYTVSDFLSYLSLLKTGRYCRREIDDMLALVGLSEKRRTRCGKLSGGMKRRLGIAQALLGDPDILILDEPTTGVDLMERMRFRSIIAELAGVRIVVYSTHIMMDIEKIAREVIFMNRGRIVRAGDGRVLLDELRESGVEAPDYEDLAASIFRAAEKEGGAP